jgi:uncharacterized phage infection (PIP) family protein YhgE
MSSTNTIDLKALSEGMKQAHSFLMKTTAGLPERISALERVTQNETEMLKTGTDKINNILSDINAQMKGMDDYIKGK